MPQVIVKYKKPETLKMLKSLSKYLGFEVSSNESTKDPLDDILVPRNPDLDINALRDIFTGKDIDAKELRRKTWNREK